MAQERNPLTPGNDPTTGTYTARGKSPGQIERDIDETRSEMSETLDAISDRVSPDHLKEQAKEQAMDFLRGPVADVGSSLLDTVKENPVPALAAALSIGWLVVKSGESDQDRRFEEDYYDRYGQYPAPGYARYARRTGRRYEFYNTGAYGGGTYDTNDDDGRSLADKAGEKASQAKDKAGNLASKAGDKASQVVDKAADLADDATDQVQRYGRRASNWLEQQLGESPMLIGAAALAAGALVGLSIPETRREHELMGRQSDRLVEQAKDLADEKIDQAKQVVRKAADEAKDKAKDVAETAKQEAKAQDLGKPPKVAKSSAPSSSTKSLGQEKTGMEKLEAKTEKAKASSGPGKS